MWENHNKILIKKSTYLEHKFEKSIFKLKKKIKKLFKQKKKKLFK